MPGGITGLNFICTKIMGRTAKKRWTWAILRKYLSKGGFAERLKQFDGVGVEFVDGNITILYVWQQRQFTFSKIRAPTFQNALLGGTLYTIPKIPYAVFFWLLSLSIHSCIS